MGNSHNLLVYGKRVIFPTNIFIPSMKLCQLVNEEPIRDFEARILLKLEDEREKNKFKFHSHQQVIQHLFDKNWATDKDFTIGDLVLKWDKSQEEKGKDTKFQHFELGPFQFFSKVGPLTNILETLEGEVEILPKNDQILKKFFS